MRFRGSCLARLRLGPNRLRQRRWHHCSPGLPGIRRSKAYATGEPENGNPFNESADTKYYSRQLPVRSNPPRAKEYEYHNFSQTRLDRPGHKYLRRLKGKGAPVNSYREGKKKKKYLRCPLAYRSPTSAFITFVITFPPKLKPDRKSGLLGCLLRRRGRAAAIRKTGQDHEMRFMCEWTKLRAMLLRG